MGAWAGGLVRGWVRLCVPLAPVVVKSKDQMNMIHTIDIGRHEQRVVGTYIYGLG